MRGVIRYLYRPSLGPSRRVKNISLEGSEGRRNSVRARLKGHRIGDGSVRAGSNHVSHDAKPVLINDLSRFHCI